MQDHPIKDEELEDLVAMAAISQEPVQVVTTSRFTAGQKGSAIRCREKYRRLSFELAGALAQEVLDLREMVKKQGHKECISGDPSLRSLELSGELVEEA